MYEPLLKSHHLFEYDNDSSEEEPITFDNVKEFRKRHRIRVYGTDIPNPFRKFESLEKKYEFQSYICRNLEKTNFKQPTPIQMQAIPILLHGRDVMAVAPTGLGLVTPLATGVRKSWEKLISKECGIVSLKSSKNDVASENVKNGIGVGDNRLSNLPYNEKENGGFNKLTSTVAGLVKPGKYEDSGFDPKEWLDPGDERKMALFTQYAICAAKQALFDAEWISISDDDKEKTGVCIGSGIGSFQDIIDTSMIYKEHACKSSFYDYGAHKVNPMFIPRVLINMAAGHLSLKYGFHGPNHSVSTACTTGAHSIGDASRFIQFGDADVMIA
ncbi:13806_t:CDS:2, partial [Entrophospora sp. SA101]